MPAAGSPRGLGGRAGPGAQVGTPSPLSPQPPLRPPRSQDSQAAPPFHHWVGGWMGEREGASLTGSTLFFSCPPIPFLLATLPCLLSAPLQPRVRGPAAGHPDAGHGGAARTVCPVRRRLLPPGSCPPVPTPVPVPVRGCPPGRCPWVRGPAPLPCTPGTWDGPGPLPPALGGALQLGTGVGRVWVGVAGGGLTHTSSPPSLPRVPSTVPGWPRGRGCSWWTPC